MVGLELCWVLPNHRDLDLKTGHVFNIEDAIYTESLNLLHRVT